MGRVSRTREAKSDVAEIWRYIAMRNMGAAERWLVGIDGKVKLLSAFPGIGPLRDDLAPDLRSYPVGNYIIFYRPVRSGVQIFVSFTRPGISASSSAGLGAANRVIAK